MFKKENSGDESGRSNLGGKTCVMSTPKVERNIGMEGEWDFVRQNRGGRIIIGKKIWGAMVPRQKKQRWRGGFDYHGKKKRKQTWVGWFEQTTPRASEIRRNNKRTGARLRTKHEKNPCA